MAWINTGPYYEWDVPYTRWSQAATRAEDLAKEYQTFTQVLSQSGQGPYIVVTQNTITEEHSIACRCEKCLEL